MAMRPRKAGLPTVANYLHFELCRPDTGTQDAFRLDLDPFETDLCDERIQLFKGHQTSINESCREHIARDSRDTIEIKRLSH